MRTAVYATADHAAVVISHDASIDRQLCEVGWPIFAEKNWACSCRQVLWRDEGHEGLELGYLLIDCGDFHNGHRAIDDSHALLALLAAPLKGTGRLALSMACSKLPVSPHSASGRLADPSRRRTY